MTHWFEEQLEVNEGRIVKIKYHQRLDSVKSPFQVIDVYDTLPFGKMLTHDNVIMVTEFDESHYHEMIVHVSMNVYPEPKRVLVIGGGDGGTLREILRYPSIETAHLCEIDGAVIDTCKKHFPHLSSSFNDSRTGIFLEDGAEFIKKHPNFYHIIIVDSSDPIGPAEVLFREEFYRNLANALTDDGIVISQSESFQYHRDTITRLVKFNKNIFPIYRYYYTMVPTYPSGVIGFSFCSKKYDPLKDYHPKTCIGQEELKYYNKDIHFASFVLPQAAARYIEEALNE